MMFTALAAAVAAGYALRARFGTTPILLSLGLLTAGAFTQGVFLGWVSGLTSFGISAALTVFLIMTRLLNRTNTFALPALVSFIPLDHWWIIVPGLVFAAISAVVKYLRANTAQDMRTLTVQTAMMGMSNQMGDIAELAADIDGRVTKKANLFAALCLGILCSLAIEAAVLYLFA